MIYYLLVTAYVIVSLLLLVVILLQQGKGGDIAAAFGGSSSQTAFGARSGATVLTRATTVLGTMFLLGALALALLGRSQGGSVVSGVGAPVPTQEAPALPTTPPPATTTPAAPDQPAGTTPTPAPAH